MHINFVNVNRFTNTNTITVHTLHLKPLGRTLEMFSRHWLFRNATYTFTSFYVITVNSRAKLVGVRSSNFQVSVCTVEVFVYVWCCRACGCVIGQFKVTQWFLIVDPLSRDIITHRFELWGYCSKATCRTIIREQVVTSNRRSCNHHMNFSTCDT